MAGPALNAPSFWHRRRREIFALVATALFFTAAELAVRVTNLAGRPPANLPGVAGEIETSIVDDPRLFWRFPPHREVEGDGRIYRINNLGLRDHDVAVPKPPGVYRILSLGESTTFGAGVALRDTYGKVAERLLRQRFPEKNIEIINAGIGAYTSFQCVKYLEIEGARLAPDMVWLFSGANDGLASFVRNFRNFRDGFAYTDRELYALRHRYAGLLGLLNRSDLYKLFRRAQTGRWLTDYGRHVAGREDELKAQGVWQTRVPPADRADNLRRFVTLTRDLGATPVLLVPAYFNTPPDGFAPLRQIAAQTHTPTVDLPRALHESGQFDALWYGLEELGGHPNATGHRLMGEAIATAVAPLLVQ